MVLRVFLLMLSVTATPNAAITFAFLPALLKDLKLKRRQGEEGCFGFFQDGFNLKVDSSFQ